jgi:serine/threonine protein kinase
MTPAPRIGTEFAGYRIEGLLGRGGMGVVYRAEHPRLGASVALKVMAPELAMDEGFRERFVREARVAARIKHPNIIPIYDAGEWQGDLYMAMRYIEGSDLRSLLRKDGVLQPQETYVIGLQIASALDAAHRNGLVHRDVKPGNILLEPGPDPDSPPIAYLADLGLTKQVDSHNGATRNDELFGTIDYMAPEQISASAVDGRADVYSLACVLFECLTGSVPYVRETKAAVLWAHLHDEVPRATAANPRLPNAVDVALSRGMAKRPADRFATGRELLAALKAPQGAATPTARDETETRATRVSPPVERAFVSRTSGRGSARRALALAAAVGALVGAGGAAAVMFLAPDEETVAPTQPPAREPANTQTKETAASAFTPFDKELVRNVPDEIRPSCRHARPLTPDFDATLSCHPGGVVGSVKFSHARSGRYLHAFLTARMEKAGLPAAARGPGSGQCSTGDVPSINSTVAMGLSGRAEVSTPVTIAERLGYVLCDQAADGARIEWLTQEVGIYAIAKGKDLPRLYEWWLRDAGPEP